MRLEKIQGYLKEKQWKYEYSEEDGLGSIDFEHRGLSYHIWEFEMADTVRRQMCAQWADRKILPEIMKRRS